MNAIIGYAELASRHLQETEKLGRYLEKIHQQMLYDKASAYTYDLSLIHI